MKGSGRATQGLAVLLAAGVVAGWVVTSPTFDPVLADVVALATNRSKPEPAAAEPKLQKVTDWQYFDNRPEWSMNRGIPQAQAPADPVMPVRPGIAPPENPHKVIFNGPPPMPTYSLEPRHECTLQHGPGIDAHVFTAVAIGGGRATVSWSDLADPDISFYQVAAVPDYVIVANGNTPTGNRPTQATYTRVNAPGTCKTMTVTIGGLQPGIQYFFELQSFNNSRVVSKAYTITRGESETILIS